jgi:hypothetical protein
MTTEHRVRQFTPSRLCQAGIVQVAVPALLLACLSTFPASGQAPRPTFSINDVSVAEGQGGITAANFTVTLSNPNGSESRVRYTTSDGTATGGVRTRVFSATGSNIPDAGGTPSPITVNVSGLTDPMLTVSVLIQGLTHPSPDHLDLLLVAPDGTAMVLQSDASGGLPVSGVTYGLRDGEPPMPANLLGGTFSPTSNPPSDLFPPPAPPGPHPEAAPAGTATLNGTFGGTNANGAWNLWVVDDTPGGQGSLAAATLVIGTQEPGTDYLDTTGELLFAPGGPATQTITVSVFGDTTIEPNETFFVNLGSVVNGTLADGEGLATILNDDGGSTLPTAQDDAYSAVASGFFGVGAAVGVLANDSSNGGGPLTAVLVSGTTNGSVTLNANGSFTFNIPPGFVGTDSFTYRAVNATGQSNIATVTITINSPTTVQPPTDLRVDFIEQRAVRMETDRLLSAMIVRLNNPPAGPTPTGFALAAGTQPGETLATIPTGSPYPIVRLENVPFGSFFVRAHSVLGSQVSGPSNEIALHVNTTVTPSAPANLLGAVDGSNLTLAWKNTFLGGIPTTSFLRVTGGASLTLPLETSETFSFPTVPPGTYTFEVLNGNAGGVSAASNAVTLSFPGPCSPPQMPTDFLLYVNGRILGATWNLPENGPAPNGYLLHVASPLFTGSVPLRTTNIRAQVVPGTYTVSVESISGCGSSAPTPTQTVVVQ